MISPRLSKVVSGTRLTTGLLNSMIKRTEYAADLLQQYKLIAGNQMYIEPHYDGTRVSYLQPVGGGTTPTQPISPAYRIVGSATVAGVNRGFVYNGSTFTDIIYPGSTNTQAFGIDGSNIVGATNIGSQFASWLYNGSTFTNIIYPGSSSTSAFGIDGSNIVGRATVSGIVKGFLYNGSTFTDIIYPGATFTQARGINGSNIVGSVFLGGIYSDGFLYDGSTFTDIVYPGATSTLPDDIG